MNPLEEIVRDEIRMRRAIPFARLMELALYCPQFGYYDRLENRIGRRGDFYTSASLGDLFGRLLAFQFASSLEELESGEIQIVEAGAHHGSLAVAILDWLQSRKCKLLDRLQFCIVEPSQSLRETQSKTLRGHPSTVRWFTDWTEVPKAGVRGVIFSNELLDAMPVHRIGWDAAAKGWYEWGVTLHGADLVWERLPLSPVLETHPLLCRLPVKLQDLLPDGFVTVICPAAEQWWTQAANALRQGWLLTFDYGLNAEEFFLPSRSGGTLRAYHGHKMNTDVLSCLGEQDLTAHVNFTAIRSAGETAGLRTEGLFPQSTFLTQILARAEGVGESLLSGSTTREFQALTHPDHLGHAFKVLVQSRGVSQWNDRALPRT